MLIEAGYPVKDVCLALGISRSGYYYDLKGKEFEGKGGGVRDEELLWKIKLLKLEHPVWGYRRVWAGLRHRDHFLVNQKRVRRVMKEHWLMVVRSFSRAKRTPQRSKPKVDRPRQYFGIDMNKFLIPSIGWVYLVIVLDWYTKKSVRLDSEIVGWDLSLGNRAFDWKGAFLGIEQIFSAIGGSDFVGTSYDNPKGNADTERVLRTIKEELIWLNEFSSLEEAIEDRTVD